MGKSLGMKAEGLSFDKFLRALVQVPREQIDKAMESAKRKRRQKKIAPPQAGR